LSYANPGNTGLGSDKRACKKIIKMVLDVLTYPENRFESSSGFEHDCRMFRMKIVRRLKNDGWIIHYDAHGITVVDKNNEEKT